MCLGEYYVSVWKKYFDMNVMVKIIFVSILLWIYIWENVLYRIHMLILRSTKLAFKKKKSKKKSKREGKKKSHGGRVAIPPPRVATLFLFLTFNL
jgi:hypothetical protein